MCVWAPTSEMEINQSVFFHLEGASVLLVSINTHTHFPQISPAMMLWGHLMVTDNSQIS